jgi:hypothetical protein
MHSQVVFLDTRDSVLKGLARLFLVKIEVHATECVNENETPGSRN